VTQYSQQEPLDNTTTSGDTNLQQKETSKPTTHPTKSAVPLAEVLNNGSPPEAHKQTAGGAGDENDNPRKKRKVGGSDAFTLPKPPPLPVRVPKRQRLPPLLPGLIDPPPEPEDGGFPSITRDGFSGVRAERANAAESSVIATAVTPCTSAGKDMKEANDVAGVVALRVDELMEPPAKPEIREPVQEPKKAKQRRKWTQEETDCLLKGVAQFGIGSWKKILECEDFTFNFRSAVDLKDRFRTCCPDQKLVSRSDTPVKTPRKRSDRKDAEDLTRLGITEPLERKDKRRPRREFTEDEDLALLEGYERYGTQWRRYVEDETLQLVGRERTDLRDRFRTRYPGLFLDAGHTWKGKSKEQHSKDSDHLPALQAPTMSTAPQTDKMKPALAESASSTSLLEAFSSTIAAPQIAQAPAQNSFKLLTSGWDYPWYDSDDADDALEASMEPGQQVLSRGIFAWVDQNYPTQNYPIPPLTSNSAALPIPAIWEGPPALSRDTGVLANPPPMDLLHINPLDTLKLAPITQQTFGSSKGTMSVADMLSAVPQGEVKTANEQTNMVMTTSGPATFTLPPPAEMVLGVEADARAEGINSMFTW